MAICFRSSIPEKYAQKIQCAEDTNVRTKGYFFQSWSHFTRGIYQIKVSNRDWFILKYDPRLPNVQEILQWSWRDMVEDPTMKKCFQNHQWSATRGQKTLGICWSKLSFRPTMPVAGAGSKIQQGASNPMESPDAQSVSITCQATGEVIDIKDRLTCSSTNIIYCITCRRGDRTCPKQSTVYW